MTSSDETLLLQNHVLNGNVDEAVGQLMAKYQSRLERIVGFRMDRRLKNRLDAQDVVQEAFIEAVGRLDDYKKCSDKMTFFLWLRFITMQKVFQLHRHHLGVAARNADREVPIYQRGLPQATSMVLAAQLLGNITSPSRAAEREERKAKLEQALSEVDELDREVLALRHYEQLSNQEVAELLEITPTAASNRYIRALRRLKSIIKRIDGDESALAPNSSK